MFLIALLSLKTNPLGKAPGLNCILFLSGSLAALRHVGKTYGSFGFSSEALFIERVVSL